MKHFLLIIILTLVGFNTNAQTNNKNYSKHVKNIDKIIESLYSVISGEKGEERDWDLMRYLFHPDAKLIPSGESKSGEYKVKYMTPDDYIKMSGEWLVENGFYEKEIHRTVNQFRNIVQVFSTYECYHSKKDKAPFMRGINSIQLLNDGTRWWIINIYWSQETDSNPIPKEYLPK